MRVVGWIVLFLCVAACPVPQGFAQDTGNAPDCMTCHKPKDAVVDPARYAKSVHNALPCTECHADGFERFPHPGKSADTPGCMDCHGGDPVFEEAAQEMKESVHVERVDPDFRCSSCHSPHYFVPASRMPDFSEGLISFNEGCLACHAAGDTPAGRQAALEELAGKHRLFPHEMAHFRRIACVGCHTPPGKKTMHLVLPKEQALRECTACHAQNSVLAGKFYKYLTLKERADRGWVNAALYNNAYLTGATRNRWLDWGTVVLTALVLLGIAAHAAIRWLTARSRRRSS